MTPYPAQAIANYFIERSNAENSNDLNIMKLIKMVYMAHGFNLAMYKQPLINEYLEAWKYGPVVDSLYHEFKGLGHASIKFLAPNEIGENQNGDPYIKSYYEIDKNDKLTKELLDYVWNICRGITGIQLSNWTHEEGSPWRKIWDNKDRNKINPQIPDELIQEYFQGMIANAGRSN